VAVEHRLAVLDQLGQAAGGHRVPPLGLGEVPGGGDDQLLALRAFPFTAFLDGHDFMLAALANLSKLC
jgi:hypothetical protein